MRIALMRPGLRTLLVVTLVGVFGSALVGYHGAASATADVLLDQVVITPAAADTVGPARSWDRVDPTYRYYRGPNYRYDAGWYGQRHLAYPNNYVAYASDPASVC